MKKFGVGLLGLIAVASANDTVSTAVLILAALPFLALLIAAIPDIAE